MNLLDSSGWLEFFADGLLADRFAAVLKAPNRLLVPTIVVYEVFKVILRERSETEALKAAAAMQQCQIVAITEEVALLAARASLKERLPMADSIILTVARLHGATIWTLDEHFAGLPRVNYYPVRR